jgi:SAM-dependent methyltransferase
VPDPALAVRELARVLKPSGTLILTTPNYLGLYGLYRGYRRLTGRPYQEAGQPLNNFVMLPRTLRWVKNAGLQVTEWDSEGQYSFWPGKNPVRRPFGDKLGPLSRLTGLHSFVAATKPAVR